MEFLKSEALCAPLTDEEYRQLMKTEYSKEWTSGRRCTGILDSVDEEPEERSPICFSLVCFQPPILAT
jgi:hypothetical protein